MPIGISQTGSSACSLIVGAQRKSLSLSSTSAPISFSKPRFCSVKNPTEVLFIVDIQRPRKLAPAYAVDFQNLNHRFRF
jgi:hypothetical protein